MENYLELDDDGQTKFVQNDIEKALKLNENGEYEKALKLIDSVTQKSHERYNVKGLILTNLSQFKQAIECFDNALDLNDLDEIKINKANALYHWSKHTFFPEMDYFKSIQLINQALEILPDSEDPSEFWFLKAEILEAQNDLIEAQKCYLKAYKEFDKLEELEIQIDYLDNTEDILFVITGTNFYGDFLPETGMIVDLIKELDNEYDPDAIAVLFEDEKIGYVANNDYTLIDEVKSATNINHLVNDESKGEILFVFLGEYIVAKLI